MEYEQLLTQIWGGAIEIDRSADKTALSALVTSLVSVPVVALTSTADLKRPVAVMESSDLMDGVSLGDILAEELGIEVPYGAMVLIQPKSAAQGTDLSAKKLGEFLGRVLLDVAIPNDPIATPAISEIDAVHLDSPVVALKDFAGNSANRLQ